MMLFPFLPFMIVDLGMVSDPREPGVYSGYIGGAFMAGRIFTSFLWGRFSDVHGRKPVVVYAMISVTVFSILFGLSPTYTWALVTRFLAGATNGILGTAKVMVSEICSSDQQARCMAFTTATWAFGTIAGSAMGGLLAQPADNYPEYFSQDGLFGTFPFLAPCLGCALLAAIAVVLAVLYVPETLAAAQGHGVPSCCVKNKRERAYGQLPTEDVEEKTTLRPAKKLDETKPGPCSLMGRRAPAVAIIAYVLHSFTVQTEFDTFPLWTAAPVSAGGLGLESSETGGMLSAMGAAQLGFSLFIFPRIHQALGNLRSFRLLMVVQTPLHLLMPLASYITTAGYSPTLIWWYVVTIRSLNLCAISGAFTTLAISMNNSVTAQERGALNGLGMTLASIGKAVGPASGSPLFAWSLMNGFDTPFDYHLVFYLYALMTMVILLWSTMLPSSTNLSPEERAKRARQAEGHAPAAAP
jgi:MFS family permease